MVRGAYQRIAPRIGEGSGERQQGGPGAEQIAERAMMQDEELVGLRVQLLLFPKYPAGKRLHVPIQRVDDRSGVGNFQLFQCLFVERLVNALGESA